MRQPPSPSPGTSSFKLGGPGEAGTTGRSPANAVATALATDPTPDSAPKHEAKLAPEPVGTPRYLCEVRVTLTPSSTFSLFLILHRLCLCSDGEGPSRPGPSRPDSKRDRDPSGGPTGFSPDKKKSAISETPGASTSSQSVVIQSPPSRGRASAACSFFCSCCRYPRHGVVPGDAGPEFVVLQALADAFTVLMLAYFSIQDHL